MPPQNLPQFTPQPPAPPPMPPMPKPPAPQPPVSGPPSRFSIWMLLGLAALVVVVCAIAGYFYGRHSAAPAGLLGAEQDSASVGSSTFSGVLVGTDPYIWAGAPSTNIFISNVDGSEKKLLTEDGRSKTPAWSCDGSHIYYDSGGTIWVMNANGSDKKQIIAVPSAAPSISCDGKVVFGSFSNRTGNPTIWIKDAPASEPRQISDDAYFDLAARISPDGTMVSFTRYINFDHRTNKDDGRQLFVMNADGTHVRQLTFKSDDPTAPNANASAWSPDSTRIAFFNGYEEEGANRTTPDKRNLAVINADGTDKQYLTHCDVTTASIQDSSEPGQCADDPVWSPDGKWIIYSSSGMKTYIIASDGSGTPEVFFDGLLLFGSGGGRPWKL